MSKPIIIIDPGHGGKDLGGGSNKFFNEKDMNLKISLYQYRRLRELEVPVKITRTIDAYLTPSYRAKLVKESGAKYCISNHLNSANPKARGVETIHSIYSDGKLAHRLYQAIVKKGMHKRRVFTRRSTKNKNLDYYFIHRKTGSVNTIIVEYGFASNPNDTKLILSKWPEYAEAVVKEFCLFIGHKYQLPKIAKDPKKNNALPILKNHAKVTIDNKTIPGFITNEGRTLVEVRSAARILGLNIEWDSSTKTVKLIKNNR